MSWHEGKLEFNDADGKKRLCKPDHFVIKCPSEHTIEGERFDAELQFVHKQFGTKNILVLSILFQDVGGVDNPFFTEMGLYDYDVDNPDSGKGREVNLNPLMERLDKTQIYNYSGSVTVPPCTSNVEWVVLSSPSQISAT